MAADGTRIQPTITADGAQRVVAAGIAKARELDAPSTVAVVDASGTLTCLVRMDGAPQIGADLARRKAHTAILLGGVDTEQTATAVAEAPALAAALAALPGIALLAGAVPLEADGVVVGAVGVSAPAPGSDTVIAAAAAAALAGA